MIPHPLFSPSTPWYTWSQSNYPLPTISFKRVNFFHSSRAKACWDMWMDVDGTIVPPPLFDPPTSQTPNNKHLALKANGPTSTQPTSLLPLRKPWQKLLGSPPLVRSELPEKIPLAIAPKSIKYISKMIYSWSSVAPAQLLTMPAHSRPPVTSFMQLAA